MKLYRNLDVTLTYQNFGSTWVLVMRGSTENLELAVNGLYNWGVTNGDCEYWDHALTVGVVWTDEPSLRRFFYLQSIRKMVGETEFRRDHSAANRVMGKLLGKRISEIAHIQANRRVRQLRRRHESFFNFSKLAMFGPEAYGNGCISAEKPDSDMKDAILSHAYSDRDLIKA